MTTEIPPGVLLALCGYEVTIGGVDCGSVVYWHVSGEWAASGDGSFARLLNDHLNRAVAVYRRARFLKAVANPNGFTDLVLTERGLRHVKDNNLDVLAALFIDGEVYSERDISTWRPGPLLGATLGPDDDREDREAAADRGR